MCRVPHAVPRAVADERGAVTPEAAGGGDRAGRCGKGQVEESRGVGARPPRRPPQFHAVPRNSTPFPAIPGSPTQFHEFRIAAPHGKPHYT